MELAIMFISALAGGTVGFLPLSKTVKKYIALISSGVMVYESAMLFKNPGVEVVSSFSFMGTNAALTANMLSLYFGILISSIAFLTVLFSLTFMNEKKGDKNYYGWLLFKSAGMLGVVFSGNFLTLFFMWEFMSWTTFFLMRQGEKDIEASSSKYMIYAIISGMTLLFAVSFVYSLTGSFEYSALSVRAAVLPVSKLLLIIVFFTVAFFIESAIYPLHLWVPDSYSNTFSPVTSFLAGISTRMGIFALFFVVFQIIGISNLDRLNIIGKVNFRYILGWFAAFTIVIPTFTALLQNDGKRLMTWHGIGQGGYMLLGISTGSSLGIAGGLFHVLNHLSYISLIILSLAAVEYRTGTTNLNRLGGLIKKQPIAFLGVLIGIIGLAGIPPMNGFVSKWFIYKSLIGGHYPFLAAAAFLGTLGTILSVYKFIHNIFLGQLPKEYENVKEAPLSMTIPIIILMIAVYLFGVYPGLALSVIAKIESAMGVAPVKWSMHGIAEGYGFLNMFVVNLLFVGGVIVAMIIFLLAPKRKLVHQYDNYAAGHFIDEKLDYNFNYHFYAAMERIIKNKLLADISYKIEKGVSGFSASFGNYIKGIYTGNVATYSMYILAAIIGIIAVVGSRYGL